MSLRRVCMVCSAPMRRWRHRCSNCGARDRWTFE